ncbi:MAG: hypothetical protein KF832_19960 [Caldilineaceae bacterium]|nr:hypothetical protein [Caldilineaceae bacterium]
MKLLTKIVLSLFAVLSLVLLLAFSYDLAATPLVQQLTQVLVNDNTVDPAAAVAAYSSVYAAAAPQPRDATTGPFPSLVAPALQAPICSVPDTQAAARSEQSESDTGWAFIETFDGDPSAPSQDLLPRTFDYAVTHRTLPGQHERTFVPYPADHGMDCSGPNPAVSPLPQHMVVTSHNTDGAVPDQSFFICKDHLMSSMGDVEGYSVTAFWPKQAFDFSNGGVLEFDVNISANHPRSWWEVLIVPRNELRIGPAHEWLPIDETYPKERLLFSFFNNVRNIQVGAGAIDPAGRLVDESDWSDWASRYPADPANQDRRIRRTMRITFGKGEITWSIRKEDGTFDDYTVAVSQLPFTQGLVLFKTHAYTPNKDGNRDQYTFHWDNIRFSGPVVGAYEAYETTALADLQVGEQSNIGATTTLAISLPPTRTNPLLFGQVHNAMQGQVLLSINDGPFMTINPPEYNVNSCYSTDWRSFLLPLDPSWLREGENTFTWKVGPRPTCVADWVQNGFAIKGLEVQLDRKAGPAMPYTVLLPMVDQ